MSSALVESIASGELGSKVVSPEWIRESIDRLTQASDDDYAQFARDAENFYSGKPCNINFRKHENEWRPSIFSDTWKWENFVRSSQAGSARFFGQWKAEEDPEGSRTAIVWFV